MSGPITRGQAQKDSELQFEVDAFNPFKASRNLPRDEDFGNPSESSKVDRTEALNTELPISESSREGSRSSLSEVDQTIRQIVANPRSSRSSSSSNLNMAEQTISLKDALIVVPEFNGSNIPLSQFLEGCSVAKEMIDPAAEVNMAKLIRSRITGEARHAIMGRTFDTIEGIKDYLKNIYSPAKTVHQLLGELGNEFQQDEENVICFANRMRDIGTRILEAHKLSNGTIEAAFKTNTENNVIDCFKRGLKPEIEQRLLEAENISDIVANAIRIERQLEAKNTLRKTLKLRTETRMPVKRNVFSCQICKEEGHEAIECKTQIKRMCEFCGKPGHSIDQCFQKANLFKKNPVVCQLCNKSGHTAAQCYVSSKCQICDNNGHNAKQCRQGTFSSTSCQICNKPGHSASTCFQLKGQSSNILKSQIETRALLTCQICNKSGHTAATCFSRQRTNNQASSSNTPTCNYCKKPGHFKADCYKRQYANESSGNGQSLQKMSAPKEAPAVQTRSSNQSLDNLLCELLPSV